MPIGTQFMHVPLLMSWLSDSGVLTKRDMQNMREDWNWEPLGYIMCHSPVRKLYSTVSKSTTIPGRKIRLLMFVCHSCSVCSDSDKTGSKSLLHLQLMLK